ncbi:helix-turn-helix transcriptional regulator [Achromobacter deleyi]|uniref:helix-turn-helix transcriptional regulator n=1 Tax=Achromobacter deleyi TaxID=1353891 RepID=UPI001492C6F5|nr:helix-turn-helix transcriptional regulator [Achromobacter deleyi]QVQ25946.1 helix-turn-helix domain-containing protein [Achromobacter deleyi]UIP21486.1 helix-turn-helix transcriptional regulator [Achromobacter deleyi]
MTGTATSQRLDRTRADLSEFLRLRRERLSPADLGLPAGGRRRTPGLRREEVAALAGVGLAWYTWFEQGRNISVSATFLENLARVLRLDAAERRHLYLLAHQRPPAEPGRTWCTVPAQVRRLMDDLPARPAYILNLRWDVVVWNAAADQVFNFSAQAPGRRNLLWMLFVDPATRQLFVDWAAQAPAMLSTFRRDFASAAGVSDIAELVDELESVSPDFKAWWREHDVHGACMGLRSLHVESLGDIAFEHSTLSVDESRHLRLVVYAPAPGEPRAADFAHWVQAGPTAPRGPRE